MKMKIFMILIRNKDVGENEFFIIGISITNMAVKLFQVVVIGNQCYLRKMKWC